MAPIIPKETWYDCTRFTSTSLGYTPVSVRQHDEQNLARQAVIVAKARTSGCYVAGVCRDEASGTISIGLSRFENALSMRTTRTVASFGIVPHHRRSAFCIGADPIEPARAVSDQLASLARRGFWFAARREEGTMPLHRDRRATRRRAESTPPRSGRPAGDDGDASWSETALGRVFIQGFRLRRSSDSRLAEGASVEQTDTDG